MVINTFKITDDNKLYQLTLAVLSNDAVAIILSLGETLTPLISFSWAIFVSFTFKLSSV